MEEMSISDRSPEHEIVVVGQFPPPVHGFAQATMDVASLLETRGFRVTRIDLKPIKDTKSLLSRFVTRLSQLANVLSEVRRGSFVYVGLSGGLRQVVDCAFLTIGRVGGAKIFVHHHNFTYLDHPTLLARVCVLIAGRSATHIVLCGGMKMVLQREYKTARNIEVMSNAGLHSVHLEFRNRIVVQRIGYLSALTKEKGILEFLRVATVLAQRHNDLRFSIAGPCRDASIRSQVEVACHAHPRIDYVGPVYGSDKSAFMQSLDVLLFPTSYRNEAEPLVLLEAMSSGIPVIAWERGCITEMLGACELQSASISRESSFVDAAVGKIESWLSAPALYNRQSAEVRAQFERMSKGSKQTFNRLFPVDFVKTPEIWESPIPFESRF
jgi:glycosyltransferase involved in cell wall biosynthesis